AAQRGPPDRGGSAQRPCPRGGARETFGATLLARLACSPAQPLQLPYRLQARPESPRVPALGWRNEPPGTRLPALEDLSDRLEPPPDDQQRSRVEDRAVRAGDDADEQCEREALQ